MTGSITVTAAALHAALGHVEAAGRVRGEHAWAAGVGALRALFAPCAAAAEAPQAAPRAAAAVGLKQFNAQAAFHAPTIGQEESQPAHADNITIPPPPAAAASAQAPDTAAPAKRNASALSAAAGKLLTAEQKRELREMWPDRTIVNREIIERLNAMGGAVIRSDARLYQFTAHLGLGRRTDIWAAQDAADMLGPAGVQHPRGLRLNDRIEGTQNIRAGWTPVQIAGWFGIDIPEAAAWHSSLRAADAYVTAKARAEAEGKPPPDEAQPDTGAGDDAGPGVETADDATPASTTEAEAPASAVHAITIDAEAPASGADAAAHLVPAEAAPAIMPPFYPEAEDEREVWQAFDTGMTARDASAEFGIAMSTLTNLHARWGATRRKESA